MCGLFRVTLETGTTGADFVFFLPHGVCFGLCSDSGSQQQTGKKSQGKKRRRRAKMASFDLYLLSLPHSVVHRQDPLACRGAPLQTPLLRLQPVGPACAQHNGRGHCQVRAVHRSADRCGESSAGVRWGAKRGL